MPTAPTPLRTARRQWLEQGQVETGLIPDALRASWARCRAFGLEPLGRPQGAPHASACLLYTSPSPRDQRGSRMPSSA